MAMKTGLRETFRTQGLAAQMRRFQREQDGSLVIFSLFLFLAILMVCGLSVDLMRNEMDRSALQAQLDRAVLAAADREQDWDAEEVVRNYLEVAGLEEHVAGIEVDQSLASSEVSATVNYETSTMFLRMSGVNRLPVAGTSTAAETITNVEVSLALDITESMDTSTRWPHLVPAAKQFVTDVLATDIGDATSINLIPFGGHVNPGAVMFDFMGGVHNNLYVDYDSSNDYSYIHETESTTQHASLAEKELLFKLANIQRVHHGGGNGNGNGGNSGGHGGGSSCTNVQGSCISNSYFYNVFEADYNGEPHTWYCNSSGWCRVFPIEDDEEGEMVLFPDTNCIEFEDSDYSKSTLISSPSYGQVPFFTPYSYSSENTGDGWCPDDANTIQYAQNNEQDLHNFIDDLLLFDGTASHVGMKYALGLLDPASQDAFEELQGAGLIPAALEGRPAAFDDRETVKYIVFMTDGETTPQYRPYDPAAEYNLDNTLTLSRIYQKDTRTEARGFFLEQCELARENGVVVFTIAFNVTSDDANDDLEDCASSPSHYFPVDQFSIDDAFETIARDITELRLVK